MRNDYAVVNGQRGLEILHTVVYNSIQSIYTDILLVSSDWARNEEPSL